MHMRRSNTHIVIDLLLSFISPAWFKWGCNIWLQMLNPCLICLGFGAMPKKKFIPIPPPFSLTYSMRLYIIVSCSMALEIQSSSTTMLHRFRIAELVEPWPQWDSVFAFPNWIIYSLVLPKAIAITIVVLFLFGH